MSEFKCREKVSETSNGLRGVFVTPHILTRLHLLKKLLSKALKILLSLVSYKFGVSRVIMLRKICVLVLILSLTHAPPSFAPKKRSHDRH